MLLSLRVEGEETLKYRCICDVKMPLCLSDPVRKNLIYYVTTMDVRTGVFFRFRPEIPFLSKFGPKNKNFQFKLKFGT